MADWADTQLDCKDSQLDHVFLGYHERQLVNSFVESHLEALANIPESPLPCMSFLRALLCMCHTFDHAFPMYSRFIRRAFALHLPCIGNAPAMHFPCSCYAVAMQLPCIYHAFTMQLPCSCHAVAMQLQCSCHAYAMHLPCNCHAVFGLAAAATAGFARQAGHKGISIKAGTFYRDAFAMLSSCSC